MSLVATFLILLCALIAVDSNQGRELHVTSDWSICLPSSPPKALVRAARDLQIFLRSRHQQDLGIVEGEKEKAIVLTVDGREKEDRFSVRTTADKIIIAGTNPRAAYQGVLFLEDRLADRPSLPVSLDERTTFPFKERCLLWDSLLTGQNKEAIGFDLEQHVREAVRLGYSGMECNRFVGMEIIQQGNPRDPYPWYTYWGPSMDQFVSSPLFEGVFPKEYLQRNLADLKHIVDVVDSFGLKPIFMGYEPRYVPEGFFKQHPDLRGPRVDHPLRSLTPRYSLCIDAPEVLEHYRVLARRLIEEAPALREMHVIFMDSGAGMCWSQALYAGRNGPERCRDVPMTERMRKFFLAIKQGFRDAGKDLPLVAQQHGNPRPELEEFFRTVPKEIELTAGDWPCWYHFHRELTDFERYLLARQRETGRRRLMYQNHFFGFVGAPTAELPLPYHLVARLKTALELELDALNTLGGIVSPPIKKQSLTQEVYRRFLLEPRLPPDALIERVAHDLGGEAGGRLLVGIWKSIHAAFEKGRKDLGFLNGTEYASRRSLVRPLVPESSALLPDERERWLAYMFGGSIGFAHAHPFRGEGGNPSQDSYATNVEETTRLTDVFRRGSLELRDFLKKNPAADRFFPYLRSHERQLRFIGHVYSTGASLYEGQAVLDRYSKREAHAGLMKDVPADAARFRSIVEKEIQNTEALIRFLEEGGDIGMVLLAQETTWGYTNNLAELLRRKIAAMRRHLPEVKDVMSRWLRN